MRNVQIIVAANGKVTLSDDILLGYSGEHNAVNLQIGFTDFEQSVYSNADYFRLVFDGYYGDSIYIGSDSTLNYIVPSEALNPPVTRCQLIGYKVINSEPDMIVKSEVFDLTVGISEVADIEVSKDADVFERTLAKCQEFSDLAEQFELNAKKSAIEAQKSQNIAAQQATQAQIDKWAIEEYTVRSAKYAASATEAAKAVDMTVFAGNNLANSVKRSVSGSAIVVSDVSPIEHNLDIVSDVPSALPEPARYSSEDEFGFITQVFNAEYPYEIGFWLNNDLLVGAEKVQIRMVLETADPILYDYITLTKGSNTIKVDRYYGRPDENIYDPPYNPTSHEYELTENGFPSVLFIDGTVRLMSYTAEIFYGGTVPGASVTATGLNLMPFHENGSYLLGQNAYQTENGNLYLNGSFVVDENNINEKYVLLGLPINLPNGNYVLSCYGDVDGMEISLVDMDGVVMGALPYLSNGFSEVSLNDSNRSYFIAVSFKNLGSYSFDLEQIKVMLSVNNCDEYESAKPKQTALADGFGKVLGLKSVSPNMTVLVSEGSLLLQYNADTDIAVKKLENEKADTLALSTVAFSGSYNDLTDKPSAENIVYANTESGLNAKNIQSAIDELSVGVNVALGNVVNSWKDIQRIVRLGMGPIYFPIGYEFTTYDSNNKRDIVWRVVGHNHHQASDSSFKNTMSLEAKYVYSNQKGLAIGVQVNAPQALFYAEQELPAGTYNFKISNDRWNTAENGKIYQFTLNNPVPQGAQIVLESKTLESFEGKSVKVYEGPTSVVATEVTTVTEGSDGEFLGVTNGKERLNHLHRVMHGGNNYAQSALRQWLNSKNSAGFIWTPKTKYDRPPMWQETLNGFMSGLTEDFLDVVTEAVVPCVTSPVFERTGFDGVDYSQLPTYNLNDKFFLLSRPEVFGVYNSEERNDGFVLEYYQDAEKSQLIKCDCLTNPNNTWLRSSDFADACAMGIIYVSGIYSSSNALHSSGVCPACIIA